MTKNRHGRWGSLDFEGRKERFHAKKTHTRTHTPGIMERYNGLVGGIRHTSAPRDREHHLAVAAKRPKGRRRTSDLVLDNDMSCGRRLPRSVVVKTVERIKIILKNCLYVATPPRNHTRTTTTAVHNELLLAAAGVVRLVRSSRRTAVLVHGIEMASGGASWSIKSAKHLKG